MAAQLLRRLPGWSNVRRCISLLQTGVAEVVAFVLGAPLAAVLMLIEPFHKFRFCHIGRVNHIGWLAVNCYYYLGCWADRARSRDTSYAVLMFDPDNRALFKVCERYLTVIENGLVNRLANLIEPFMKRTRFFIYEHRQFRHFEPWCSKTGAVVSLSKDEEREGRRWLEQVGIGPEDWFACFHARDPAYDDSIYRNYRNCRIENYLAAAEHITKCGGFAIRMGAEVSEPLPATGNKKIIDYASHHRSEFLDIYLSAKCRYFVGNTSGIIVVPLVFGRPFAQANCIPYCDTGTKFGCPWIPKLMRDKVTGRLLSFREIHKLGLFSPTMTSELFITMCADLNLEWIENSSEDVLELCQDMDDVVNDIAPPPRATEIQNYYRDQFVPYRERLAHVPHIAPRFAIRHRDLIMT